VNTATIQQNAGLFLNSRRPQERSVWQEYYSRRLPTIHRVRADIASLVRQVESDTQAKLQRHESHLVNAAGDDLLFDERDFADSLVGLMGRNYPSIFDAAGAQLFDELSDDYTIPRTELPYDAVRRFIENRENHLRGASQEIWDEVRNAYLTGRGENETRGQISDRIKTAFDGIADGRAATIASTETAAAFGYARHQGMVQSGVKNKRWLCAMHNSRAAHVAAQGQVVPIDQPFIVMDEKLMHPGDENGSPENVINCHCIEIAV
jgi:uncharacterized protein with gpF-like domain